MGPIEQAVRCAVREGDSLSTPTQSEPFRVGRISTEGIVLHLGQKQTATFFGWSCLEGVLPNLEQGPIRINGSGKSQLIVEHTLDGYLKQHVNRLTAGWVAALLERAGVVAIDRTRSATVRVATDWRSRPQTAAARGGGLVFPRPSTSTEEFYIYVTRLRGSYPCPTENAGKWLIFAPVSEVDEVWDKIRQATEDGQLGDHRRSLPLSQTALRFTTISVSFACTLTTTGMRPMSRG
jgi:hypothetical protein